MLDWISQHKDVLNLAINLGMLLVWLVYAQLLYLGFRRQRRPRLIINRGKKKDIGALCIISNMSAESVFIEYIIATLETSRGDIVMDVTDFEQEYSEGDEEGDGAQKKPRRTLNESWVNENTRQGPLGSGEFVHIGTFSDLIGRLARQEGIEMDECRPKDDLTLNKLTIRLISIYGPEDMPIGAERSFELEVKGDECSLTPTSWDTKRMTSMRQRRALLKQIEQFNSTASSTSSLDWQKDDQDEKVS